MIMCSFIPNGRNILKLNGMAPLLLGMNNCELNNFVFIHVNTFKHVAVMSVYTFEKNDYCIGVEQNSDSKIVFYKLGRELFSP